MNKKGELEIQETMIVVLIFVVLIIGGMVFYYKYEMANIQEGYMENTNLRFNALRSTFSDISEIKCSVHGQSEDCVDVYKVMIFNSLSKNYLERYGFMEISIREIYPNQNEEVCSLSQKEGCGVWFVYSHIPEKYDGLKVLKTPVSLYFPSEDDYGIGELVIKKYV